jgi:hypothetical protein
VEVEQVHAVLTVVWAKLFSLRRVGDGYFPIDFNI